MFIGEFERNFGRIPRRDILAANDQDRQRQQWEYWQSEEGKKALYDVVMRRVNLLKERGKNPEHHLDQAGMAMVQKAEGHVRMQEYAKRRKEASAARKAIPRCPSGKHGIGEPCAFAEGGVWRGTPNAKGLAYVRDQAICLDGYK